MLNKQDPLVQFKLAMLDRCLPAESTAVFGDIWGIDGGYTLECAERGCERVLLVDSLETPAWQAERLRNPRIEFRKGDFSNPLFMKSFDGRSEVGVAFDILLHQPAMLGTLTLLLAKVEERFCVVQPMLEEQPATFQSYRAALPPATPWTSFSSPCKKASRSTLRMRASKADRCMSPRRR